MSESVGSDLYTAGIVKNTGEVIRLVKKKYGLIQDLISGKGAAAHIGIDHIGTIVVSRLQSTSVCVIIGVELIAVAGIECGIPAVSGKNETSGTLGRGSGGVGYMRSRRAFVTAERDLPIRVATSS